MSKKLVWLDLETTGLDANQDVILECAWVLADFSRPFAFEPGTSGHHVLKFDPLDFPGTISDYVRDMHARSGLWELCKSSLFSAVNLDEALCEVIPTIPEKEDRWIIAGSTIHFDLGFLRRYCPRAAARLSHRCYDVSAFKLLAESLGMPKLPKAEAHRSYDDILESRAHGAAVASWIWDSARLGKSPW